MMTALQTLLEGIVDYAGLFPPASHTMQHTARSYAAYQRGPDAWLLGRLIIPAARLGDFEVAAGGLLPAAEVPWRISALVGDDLAADCAAITAFNARHAAGTTLGRAIVDTVELKADSVAALHAAFAVLPRQFATFVELPIGAEPGPLLATLRALHGGAKVRTGGVTPDAIPAAADLARFLRRCCEHAVPFKATAGLHHPLRSEQALTYAPDSPRAVMWGFLNVFLATALLVDGGRHGDVSDLLEERDPAALDFRAEGVCWREHLIHSTSIRAARQHSIRSFGSCSFEEPLADLKALELL